MAHADYAHRIERFRALADPWVATGKVGYHIPTQGVKDTYGDLDVVFWADDTNRFIDYLDKVFVSAGRVRHGPCTSLEWDKFQVDMICVPVTQFDMARNFFSHGDHAANVGRVFRYYHFKLGSDGVFFRVRLGQRVHEQPLTRNWQTAMSLLNYPVLDIDTVYSDDQLFNHLKSSPWFHPKIFNETTLSGRRLKRPHQVKMFDRVRSTVFEPRTEWPRLAGWYLLFRFSKRSFIMATLSRAGLAQDTVAAYMRARLRRLRMKLFPPRSVPR